MSSACPSDNSTEALVCLLRQISFNTQPGWNWNPLNFAVTAAIGALALVIACITVFQGLLAAGPGRLKASSLAIGPFSTHSRSRFDRTEFALRTTARVPLITWDVVYHRIVRQKFHPQFHDQQKLPRRPGLHLIGGGSAAHSKVWDRDRDILKDDASTNERHQYDSTATWLTLLSALGLDDAELFPLVQRVTDYLPTDVQAAPAAGELRCLAILAVIADSNAVIEMAGAGNRFLRVIADSSQLVFRDHPSLGTVAAYEAYEETAILKVGDAPPLQFGTQFPALSFQELDRCLQLASGRLAYANGRIPPGIDGLADQRGFMTLVQDLQNRSTGCGHDVCSQAYHDWENCLSKMRERKKGWKLLSAMKMVYMSASLLAAERSNLCRGFPRDSMKLKQALVDVLGLDEFWSTEMGHAKTMQLQRLAWLTFWNKSWISGDQLSASWVVDFQDIQSIIDNPFTSTPHSQQRQIFADEKTMHVFQIIRGFVARQMEPTDASMDGVLEYKMAPQSAAQMLGCLDNWLLKQGGTEASCSMLRLLYELGYQASLLTTPRHDQPARGALAEYISARSKRTYPRGSGTVDLTDEKGVGNVIETYELSSLGMSTLLILRASLMALMLNEGADTSVLFQADFRNSVVRML